TMDVVVFPHIIVPLLVMDERIMKGINQVLDSHKLVFLVAAKDNAQNQNAIGMQDLYSVGTIGSIMRVIKLPEGGIKILVHGIERAVSSEVLAQDSILMARLERSPLISENQDAVNSVIRRIRQLTDQMSSSTQAFSPDFHIILSKMQDPQKIADFILSHLNLKVGQAQTLLESKTQEEFL